MQIKTIFFKGRIFQCNVTRRFSKRCCFIIPSEKFSNRHFSPILQITLVICVENDKSLNSKGKIQRNSRIPVQCSHTHTPKHKISPQRCEVKNKLFSQNFRYILRDKRWNSKELNNSFSHNYILSKTDKPNQCHDLQSPQKKQATNKF